MKLEDVRRIAGPACRAFNVRRLDAFGSVARGSATSTSDVDLLVEFADPEAHLAQRYFGLLHRLEDGLHCAIDLLTVESVRNPYVRARILKERVPLYEG
ncbi:hypothetical protein GX586_05430 [bacterium]|nr:hypothetical protein [bacterium]